MQINFLSGPTQKPDDTVTHVDVWFDKDQTKVWYVTCYNAAGDQVGDSIDCALKADAAYYGRRTVKDVTASGNAEPTLTIGKRNGSY